MGVRIKSDDGYRDVCTVLTWYACIPAHWKNPKACRDAKVFKQLRKAALKYEREQYESKKAP